MESLPVGLEQCEDPMIRLTILVSPKTVFTCDADQLQVQNKLHSPAELLHPVLSKSGVWQQMFYLKLTSQMQKHGRVKQEQNTGHCRGRAGRGEMTLNPLKRYTSSHQASAHADMCARNVEQVTATKWRCSITWRSMQKVAKITVVTFVAGPFRGCTRQRSIE